MRKYPLIDDDMLVFSGSQTSDQVGDMMRTIKEMSGMTAEKIAERLHVTATTVYRLWGRYEAGPNRKRPISIKLDTLADFAGACGYDLEIVLRKKENINEQTPRPA